MNKNMWITSLPLLIRSFFFIGNYEEAKIDIFDSEIFKLVHASVFQIFVDAEEFTTNEEDFEDEKSIFCGLMACW